MDDGSEPLRHQVTDIPVIEPFTDEWRLRLGLCVDCGQAPRAELPPGAPRSNFGSGLTALVALLTGVYRVGYLFYTKGKRQNCWSHLIREFVGFSERGGITGEIGKDLLKLTRKALIIVSATARERTWSLSLT